MLNTIVNSLLGRYSSPPITPQEDRALRDIQRILGRPEDSRSKAVQATYDLCPLMDELEELQLSADVRVVTSVERLLHRLRMWTQSLPEECREWTDGRAKTMAFSDLERYRTGHMHVACAYYFAVILATRHFLTADVLSKMKRRCRSSADGSSGTRESAEEEGSATLAHVCVHAAISLANVGHTNLMSKEMNNMCLLKYVCDQFRFRCGG